MKAIAHTYFGSIATNWKKKSTPEGSAKLAVDTERKKIRSRREAVSVLFVYHTAAICLLYFLGNACPTSICGGLPE